MDVELRNICTSLARRSDLEVKIVILKHRGFGALLEVELRKICTTPARESDFCKKTPRCMFGALLEVGVAKICTTPARESHLEAKIVKAPGARDVFGGSK